MAVAHMPNVRPSEIRYDRGSGILSPFGLFLLYWPTPKEDAYLKLFSQKYRKEKDAFKKAEISEVDRVLRVRT
jgi:hypothetical protein